MCADTVRPPVNPDTPDYRSTVFLPETDFPMRAGLPQREPDWLARWERIGVYDRLREKAAGRTPFTLHDGPPYANGHLHIGHALNKVLKDMVVRSQQMMGRDARYVPGWDCHGLPIEWKIEEQYRAKGLNKDDVDVVAFRQECRKFAEGWVDIQREEFKRLGVTGNWADPYLTMDYHAEAVIAAEFMKFLMNGSAVSGVEAGDVVAGGEDGAGRGGGRVSRPYEPSGLGARSRSCIVPQRNDLRLGYFRTRRHAGECRDLDHDAWTIPQNRAVASILTIAYGLYEVTVSRRRTHAHRSARRYRAGRQAGRGGVCGGKGRRHVTRLRDVTAVELESV